MLNINLIWTTLWPHHKNPNSQITQYISTYTSYIYNWPIISLYICDAFHKTTCIATRKTEYLTSDNLIIHNLS